MTPPSAAASILIDHRPLPDAPSFDSTSSVGGLTDEIRGRSGQLVVATPPSGPRFANHRQPRRQVRPGMFVSMLTVRDRVLVAALTATWVVFFLSFWAWWLQPEHRVGWIGLTVNSLLIAYFAIIPVYLLVVANRLREPNPTLPLPDVRVAFVVTRAPSEAWSLARATLDAMRGQDFPNPFDIWLCDEAPTREVLSWCAANGVQVSSRHGVAAYHRADWPRRTRCKEGNLAHFYDNWGYDNYDVVVHLDCDHVPEPSYLTEIVRPFSDPAVGYVAAPSVCDANAAGSWAARGRLYAEATFHGPGQVGHNGGLAPVIIGSHYAVRTAALREIGGIGPELAEDFSTAFLLNSAGWQGAFAIRALAHGDGPNSFGDMLTQEFQWARSLTMLLLGLAPDHLRRLPKAMRLRFGYHLLHYPLRAMTTIGGLALLTVAAVADLAWVNVNYLGFLVHWWPMPATLLALVLLLRTRGLLRPHDVPLLSWENTLYVLTAWPYNAWGVFAALVQRVRPKPVTFRVTPKGPGGFAPLSTRLILPYVGITTLLSGAALVGEQTTTTVGYVGLCLLSALTYAIVTLAVTYRHALEAARTTGTRLVTSISATVRGPLAAGVAALVPLAIAITLYPGYLAAVFGW